jgi:hypothetical protein
VKEMPVRENIKIKDNLDLTSIIESATECFKKKKTDSISPKNLTGNYSV